MTRKAATPPRQPELKGMPVKTKAVLRAEELCAALDEIEAKKENAKHRSEALIQQLKADNLIRVVCLDSTQQKRTFVLEALEKLKMKKGKA